MTKPGNRLIVSHDFLLSADSPSGVRQTMRTNRNWGAILLALGVGCSTETEEEQGVAKSPVALPELLGDQAVQDGADVELVYESIRVVSAATGLTLESQITGELSLEQQHRAARPWSYFDEEFLYHDQGWARPLQDGSIEHGYRVFRSTNPAPVSKLTSPAPPSVTPSVETTAKEKGWVAVVLHVRNFPEWNVPPSPVLDLSTTDMLAYAEARESALLERELLAETLSAPIVETVWQCGGKVLERGRRSGWIAAEVNGDCLETLGSRTDLYAIDELWTGEGGLFWPVGEGRTDARLGVDRFVDNGYHGDQPNPTRHGYGDLVLLVADGGFEDEACFFFDGANCTGASRLQERLDCSNSDGDADICEPIANYADLDTQSSHGTLVASVAMADYKQNQCEGYLCGDSVTSHSDTWENRGTGMSREARVILAAMPGGTNAWQQWEHMFYDAQDRNVDVVNGSWGTCVGETPTCNLPSVQPFEYETEDSFDDGIFVVMAAGNNLTGCYSGNCAGSKYSSCSLASPADVPKAFAVNSYDSSTTACGTSYNSCLLDTCYYRRGGIDAKVNGTTHSEVVTGISVLAPDRVTYSTNNQGDQGMVVTGVFNGTSAAAPQVAGMAIDLKDQALQNGWSWINSPGYMHALMLMMGDRHYESTPGATTQRDSGGDKEYGFGKLRMRSFGTGAGLGSTGLVVYGLSFTSTGSWGTTLFPTPMPTGTDVAKCVVYHAEDMSPPKDDISNVNYYMRVWNPGTGGACSGMTSYTAERSDNSLDTKGMMAFEAPAVTLDNKCLTLTVNAVHVTSGDPNSGITLRVACYFAGVGDDQAPGG